MHYAITLAEGQLISHWLVITMPLAITPADTQPLRHIDTGAALRHAMPPPAAPAYWLE